VAETALEGELVPAGRFRQRMAEDDAFRERVMASVAVRFGEYQQLVEEVALTGFDARLARGLLRLAGGDGRRVAATHAALASETGSGRAYVSRRLAEFARQGVVAQREGGIEILDMPALQRIAADMR